MRYEVRLFGVPEDRRSIIVEADNEFNAILATGIVLGKALKRNSIKFNASKVRVRSVMPTDKPIQHIHVIHKSLKHT